MSQLEKEILNKLHQAVDQYGNQVSVANKIKIEPATLNNIFNGKRKNITIATFEKMLPILNGIDLYIDGHPLTQTQNSHNITTQTQINHSPNSTLYNHSIHHIPKIKAENHTNQTLHQLQTQILNKDNIQAELKIEILQMIQNLTTQPTNP